MSEENPTEPKQTELVEKLLKEKKNWQLKAEQEAKEKNDLQAKLKEKEDSELLTQQKYKELYEERNKEVTSFKERFATLEKEKEDGVKRSALRKELEKRGIKQERADFVLSTVDLNALKYDSEHKIVLGVEEQAKIVQDTLPEVFAGPNVNPNHDAPKGVPVAVDMESFKRLTVKEQQDPEVLKKLYASHGITVR